MCKAPSVGTLTNRAFGFIRIVSHQMLYREVVHVFSSDLVRSRLLLSIRVVNILNFVWWWWHRWNGNCGFLFLWRLVLHMGSTVFCQDRACDPQGYGAAAWDSGKSTPLMYGV